MKMEKKAMVKKKKFDLSSDMINLERSSPEEERIVERVKEDRLVKSDKRIYINFSVTEDFKKEFKVWCAEKELKHNEALILMFNKMKNIL